jgi:rubrerythrin
MVRYGHPYTPFNRAMKYYNDEQRQSRKNPEKAFEIIARFERQRKEEFTRDLDEISRELKQKLFIANLFEKLDADIAAEEECPNCKEHQLPETFVRIRVCGHVFCREYLSS